jgi:hypothetical protein
MRIQAGGRFVENDQVRIVDERLGQADAALHAFGKFADGAHARLAEADHFEQLLGAIFALVGRQSKEIAEKIERLVRIEVAVEIRFFGQVTDHRLGA